MEAKCLLNLARMIISEDTERYKSILRLPGGSLNQLKTLKKIIQYVSMKQLPLDQFERWLMQYFRINENTATNSRYVLERANLLRRTIDNRVTVTNDANIYLKSHDILIIIRNFIEAYWGFAEIIDLSFKLQNNNGVILVSDVLQGIREAFYRQFNYNRKYSADFCQLVNILAYLRSFNIFEACFGDKIKLCI